MYNASTGTYGPATAVTATTGTGANAQSIIYVSPTVFTTGYNPDAMIAELAHELIHAYLDQNNITGVDEDYLAWSYQADVYKAQAKTMNTSDDDYAKYLQYSAAAQSAANQPGFNNATNATALSHLPSVPTNVTPCQ